MKGLIQDFSDGAAKEKWRGITPHIDTPDNISTMIHSKKLQQKIITV